jgi:MYXO-CTERM domain-containing protein
MTRAWGLLLCSLLGGCLCPTYEGLDGEITFRSCADPAQPVARSTVFEVSRATEEEPPLPTTWSSSAPAVIDLRPDADGAGWFVATGVGVAEVSAAVDGGPTDRLRYEVAEAGSATWLDPIGAVAADLWEQSPELVVGEPLDSHPGARVQLASAEPVDLSLELFDDAGRRLTWSPQAVAFDGVRDAVDLGAVAVVAPTTALVFDDVGAELGRVEVVEGDLAGATVELSAYWTPRDQVEQPEPGQELTLAWLRAVVRDAAGEPVLNAPVAFEARGAGRASRMVDEEDSPTTRRDVGVWIVPATAWGRLDSLTSCVVATIDGDAASVWFTPDGAEAFDDDTCGGNGCGCSTAARPSSAGLAVLLLLLGVRRRP